MKFLITRLSLFLSVCAFLAPLAHANDSAVFDKGKNVYPINNENIRMVSEKVIVHRKNVSDIYIKRRIANVDCEFLFENITDETQKVKIGFPGIECATTDPNCFAGLNKFVSYVNGEKVPVSIKEEEFRHHYKNKEGKDVPVGHYLRRNWYTWDVTFPPRSKVKLRNTYETVLGSDTIGHYWFEYVLVTGENWSGPIGSAVIKVIYEDEDYLRRRVGKVQPSGYKIQGNKIIWELKDFTPKENVHIFEISNHVILGQYVVDFAAYFNSKEYDAAERLYTHIDLKNPVAIHKEWLPQILYPLISRDVISEALERLYVAQLRNEIFARHGKKPDTMAMYMIFGDFLRGTKSESVSWYEYNPNYSDDLLNDIEKKNIKFIEDYERERGWR